jgi:para-aminobenzoate synthetase component 1
MSRAIETTLPLIDELSPAPDAEACFRRLVDQPFCLFLDSARRDPALGRYSFIAVDPFDRLMLPVAATGALALVRERIAPYRAPLAAGLPPFQGGAAGLFSYDLGRQLERLPAPACDEFQLPALALGLYDVVLAFDHLAEKAWIISQGFPEIEPSARRRRAQERVDWLKQLLERDEPARAPSVDLLPRAALAPQFEVRALAGLTSNLAAGDYLATVAQAIEYIRAGDIFQVNLAQRLLYPAHDHAADLYLRLRRRNPATFAAYFDLGTAQIASASPERLARVTDGHVQARPIKGTRARVARPEADLYSADDLKQSEKDRAENIMIVDLLRNDLSRVCQADSVTVRELCRLEEYEYVQHLVSIVEGRLRADCDPLDLLQAAFPGGSVTGAPKVRAMEIIAELEPTARGAYCGSLAYLGFDGAFDASILIRTVTCSQGWWQAPVGGGIVSQSLPEQEYAETWHKAEGMLRAFVP